MQELKQRLASPPAELTPAERKVGRGCRQTGVNEENGIQW
ncbi:hypothetical protein ACLBUN_32080, partial [Pseudomonas aeruginosa]